MAFANCQKTKILFNHLFLLWLIDTCRFFKQSLQKAWPGFLALLSLGGVFFYILNDFFHVQIFSMVRDADELALFVMAASLALPVSFIEGRGMKILHQHPTHYWAWSVGASPKELHTALRLRRLCIFLASLIFQGTFIAIGFWSSWISGICALLTCALMAYAGTRVQWERRDRSNQATLRFDQPWVSALKRIFKNKRAVILAAWRLQQILMRRRITQALIGGSLLSWTMMMVLALKQQTAVLPLVSFVGGFLLALILPLQLCEDMNFSWLERHAGVSHDEFVHSYFIVTLILALFFVILQLGMFMELPWISTLKTILCGLTPLIVAPALLFQVDPRRPSVTALMILLLGGILGTAVVIQVVISVVLPLILFYGLKLQKDRFYRA